MHLLFALACAAPGTPADTGDAPPGPDTRPWTFAVFLNGDNDLEDYVLHDLNELELGGASNGAHVVVQADRIEGYDDSDGDWTGARRYTIVQDDDPDAVVSPVVEELGEVDMGDPAVLTEFIAWVDANYPSERLALVLWNHGDGWLATGNPPGAISYDDTTGTVIGVADGGLTRALSARVPEHGPVDLLAFDGCNMGAYEVVYALRGVVEVASVSQSWVGWEGLQYTPALETLRETPDISTADFADALAYDAVTRGAERTWSAVDVAAMDDVAAELDALTTHIRQTPDPVATFQALRRGTATTDPAWHDWYLDLGDLAAVAQGTPSIGADAAPLQAALDAAVIGAYGDDRFGWTNGLTVFGATDDASWLALYGSGPWAEASAWDELLHQVHMGEVGF